MALNEKAPTLNLIDRVKGLLTQTPIDVLRHTKSIDHSLKHDKTIAAYQYLNNPEICTNARKETLAYLAKKYTHSESPAYNLLEQMIKAKESLAIGNIEDAVKISSFAAFEEVTKDAADKASLHAKQKMSVDIFHKRSGGDGPADVGIMHKGEEYGRQSILGFAALGLLVECRHALAQQKMTYGHNSEVISGVDYTAWAINQLKEPTAQSFTLVRALLEISSDKEGSFDGLNLAQKATILKQCQDDDIKSALVKSIYAKDTNHSHGETAADRAARAAVLIDYLKTENGVTQESHSLALQALLTTYRMHDNSYLSAEEMPIKRSFYDAFFSEIPKANMVVLGMLDTTAKVESFINEYNYFKMQESRDRVPTAIIDLIPEETKSPHAIMARNKLASVLFETAENLYTEPGAPASSTINLMDAALRFTCHALADRSLPAENEHKQKSMWLMREIILAQRQKKVSAEQAHAQTLENHKNTSDPMRENYLKKHETGMSSLGTADLALHHLENCGTEEVANIAKSVRQSVHMQQKHISILQPKPAPNAQP